MKKNRTKFKGMGLIGKVAVLFLAFSIISLIICTIVTYYFQAKTFKELKCNEVESISEYLVALMEKEGQSFIDYVDYYKDHYQDIRIPMDFDEYQTAYREFLDAFSKAYPDKTLYSDISPNELPEDLQLLYYTYYHEYWLITYDETLEAFDISYAYFILLDEENYGFTYMIDAGRIPDEEHPGYALLGETYYEDPDSQELMWRTWTTGEQYHEVMEWIDDYGHTYTSFVPLWINGQKIGLVGSDILIEQINTEMLKRTIVLVAELGVFLLLLTIGLLALIEGKYIIKIRSLSAYVKKASKNGKYVTASKIRNMHLGKDELGELSDSIADMLIELDEHEKEVERVARMKSDFLANMSHELRTPMNAVIGMTELIQREETNDAVANYAKQIKSSGTALLAIINDILDYSKIESGKFDIVPVEYHPVEEINDVSNIILNKLSEKPVVLDVDIDPNLPKVLCGDSNRIRQILINIAGNAVKFTNKGSVTIRAAFERTDDRNILLKLIVKDTGIGIKEEDKKKLFDSFTQLDSKRNRNVEGTGLGLAITKRLVELMNGSLKIDSEYGKGSIFTVEIPQQIVDGTPSAHVNEPEKCAALYMFSNPVSNSAFERDATRLGVISKEVKERINMKQECLDMLSKHPGCTLFVFTDTVTVTSLRPEFVNSRNDILPVLVTDYGSKLKLSLQNLIFGTNPLFTANMAMIFNKEKEIRSDGSETDVADFTAPFANILVVDDNHVNLTIAEGLLEPLKMNIKKASSGKEAIRLCGVNKFDLILMDHMMPEMDGVEAMHAIREKYPEYVKKPIIALTANAVGDAKKALLDEGMNDFIPKPIDVKTLMAIVRKWLPAHLIMKMTDEEIAKAELAQKDKKPSENLVIGDLNVQDAIAKLGGEALFYNILKDYYRIIPEKSALIRKALEEKDWKSFTIEVHSLKSTSGQIGATEVQRLAAKLEDAGRKEDEAFIKENAGELLERYTAYESVFKPFCDDGKDKNVTKSEVDKEVLLKAFDDLRAAADDLDFDRMEEIVEKLSRYRYSDIEKELFMKLKKAVSDIDPDTALEMISEWNDVL